MLNIKYLLESTYKFTPIDLGPLTRGMTRSGSDNDVIYSNYDLKSNTTPKSVEDAAGKSGYSFSGSSSAKVSDKTISYRTYKKLAGPYKEHILKIGSVDGTDDIWNIEHKTVQK